MSSTNSARHRPRETLAAPTRARGVEHRPRYIRSWEQHDLDVLMSLLRVDVTPSMPPQATWFHGPLVGTFFGSQRFAGFWTRGTYLATTRANDQLAIAFYAKADAVFVPHSIQLASLVDDRVAEMVPVHRCALLPRLRSPQAHRGVASLGVQLVVLVVINA